MPHEWVYRLDRLCGLTAGERAALVRAGLRTRSVEPHADIISAGKLATECHVIVAGFAGTYVILPDANRQIISIHIPGDFCDLHALLAGPQMESVTALGPVTIGVVPHRALLDIAWEYPRVLFALWHDTLVDKAIHRAWVTNLRRDAYGRLGHLLCEMRARLDLVGLANDASGFALPLTQTDLGDAVGLSIVHVNRTLQRMRAEGLITWQRDHVAIRDRRALESAVGFDGSYLKLGSAAIPNLPFPKPE